MKITLCVYTDGRGEYLVRTMQSLTERVAYQFDHALMIDDSGNAEYAQWLDRMFPSFRHIHHAQRLGFAVAIRSAWSHVPKCDYLLSVEGDFTFNRDVRIEDFVRILEMNPRISQVAMLRQPWNSAEKEAGGILQLHPQWYEEQTREGLYWLEQYVYFTTNPNLMRYELIHLQGARSGQIAWPNESESEGKFGSYLRLQGRSFAFYGKRDDEPLCHHIGEKRIGFGY